MNDTFTREEAAMLAPYVTNVEQPIYALKNLPEEVVAVLFAYYSRSRESLRQNLLKLIQERDIDVGAHFASSSLGEADLTEAKEKARQFHEKWVVGYGHASVAEHAVVHLAIEDASIIAIKIIEDSRLASYTEKSTRYVLFDDKKFYRVPRLIQSPFAALYEDTVRALLHTYGTLVPQVVACVKKRLPQRTTQSVRAYETACRAKAYDLLRYLLPASTLTNLGLTINARALEHLLTKLLSDPLAEARDLATAMKREAVKVVPTLLKYADYNPYLADTDQVMRQLGQKLFAEDEPLDTPSVSLVRFPEDAEQQLAAAIAFGYAHLPWVQMIERISKLPAPQRQHIIDEYLQRRGPHDQPLRALEHLYYTFDIVLDYGAFRDIQRHRMATQTRQDLSTRYGYSVPQEIVTYGLGGVFHECMTQAAAAYTRIAEHFPLEAQYVLPLAYRIRVLFTWNLRELCHFIQLRSARQGHASYRRIAQEVYREIERVHPTLARFIRVDLGDYHLGRL
jgi:flavin-dependent thymidylate synthase